MDHLVYRIDVELCQTAVRVPTVLVKKISRTFPGPQKHFSRTLSYASDV